MNTLSNYGLLIDEKAIKLHRMYFKELCALNGIKVVYRAPKDSSKHYDQYTEEFSNYEKPEVIDCIFEEHPQQETIKKLGWVSELQTNSSIIHVPYDLKGLQKDALFIVPSAIDNSEGRLFRAKKLSTIMIFPASISVEIIPEYENTFEDDQLDFKHSGFNVLNEEEDIL